MKILSQGILIMVIMSLLAGCASNPPQEESKDNPAKWQKDIEIIQPRR